MASSGMHNLTTLIKRLEAATSRLEDIASSNDSPIDASQNNIQGTHSPSTNGDATLSRATTAPLPPTEEVPEAIIAFDTLVDDELKSFATSSDNLGSLAAEQSSKFCSAFKAQRDVILVASKAKEPSQSSPIYMEILKELIQGIEGVNNIRDQNRKAPQENHLSMLADGVGLLSWVTVKPSPDKYVTTILEGAQFYGNKILTAFKDKGTEDVDWVKSFVKLCGALVQYIKQHHPKGLEWNAKGMDAEEAFRSIKSAPGDVSAGSTATKGGAAPPPPPPPPPPLPQFDAPGQPSGSSQSGGDMGAVFQELNRGESVTSGLRKVDKSEMTHKNPFLRAQAPVSQSTDNSSPLNGRAKSPAPPAKKKPESMRAKKPSKMELEANKWTIENFEDGQGPIEVEAERNQSILISRCKSVQVQVKGKANAISVDSCSRLDIVVDSLVSSVGVVNSSNFRMQVLGTLPSIQLDKVDGAIVFLSEESLSTDIFTSKCSSVNITLPPAEEEDDSVECPVPEQIKTTIVNGKLVNEIVVQDG